MSLFNILMAAASVSPPNPGSGVVFLPGSGLGTKNVILMRSDRLTGVNGTALKIIQDKDKLIYNEFQPTNILSTQSLAGIASSASGNSVVCVNNSNSHFEFYHAVAGGDIVWENTIIQGNANNSIVSPDGNTCTLTFDNNGFNTATRNGGLFTARANLATRPAVGNPGQSLFSPQSDLFFAADNSNPSKYMIYTVTPTGLVYSSTLDFAPKNYVTLFAHPNGTDYLLIYWDSTAVKMKLDLYQRSVNTLVFVKNIPVSASSGSIAPSTHTNIFSPDGTVCTPRLAAVGKEVLAFTISGTTYTEIAVPAGINRIYPSFIDNNHLLTNGGGNSQHWDGVSSGVITDLGTGVPISKAPNFPTFATFPYF